MTAIGLDFESFYSKDFSVSDHGAVCYANDPRSSPYMVSFAGSDGLRYVGGLEDAPWEALAGCRLLCHNLDFDLAILNTLNLPEEWRPAEMHDTAALVAYLGVGRSLQVAAEHLLGVAVSKAPRDYSKGKSWPEDYSEEQQQEMRDYCLRDSIYCLQLWEQYADQWPEHERRLSQLTVEMGQRGVPVCLPAVRDGIKTLTRKLEQVTTIIPWGDEADGKGKPVPVTSPLRFKALCAKEGIPAPASMAKGSSQLTTWLGKYADTLPGKVAAAFADHRSINRTIKLLEKFESYSAVKNADGTDRLRFSLKSFGSHTGRWAGGGS